MNVTPSKLVRASRALLALVDCGDLDAWCLRDAEMLAAAAEPSRHDPDHETSPDRILRLAHKLSVWATDPTYEPRREVMR